MTLSGDMCLAYLILALATTEIQTDANQPSKALLEFLGSFENADGEWIDPMTLPAEIDQQQAPSSHDDEKQDDEKQQSTSEEPKIEA